MEEDTESVASSSFLDEEEEAADDESFDGESDGGIEEWRQGLTLVHFLSST